MTKPTIQAMREWLLTCPLIDAQMDDCSTLRMNFLGAEPVQFSIEDAPADPILRQYMNGALRAKNYALTSCMEYSEQNAVQAANSGFFDDLCEWIDRQNTDKTLPDLGGGRRAEAVAVNTSGYIIATSDSTCKFQLQLQLQYFKPKGA